MIEESQRVQLKSTPAAPRQARRHLVAFCDGLPEHVVSAAELLISELVTNAVVHRSPAELDGDHAAITVNLRRTPDLLRVEVIDSDPTPVRAASWPSTPTEPGWGLHLLSQLATDWGFSPLPAGDGKTVWFAIETPLEPAT